MEKPKDEQLNELISNILSSQAVMMSIVTSLMLKVRNLEYAVKERQVTEGHFGERKDGDSSGQTAEAGSRYCTLYCTNEEADKQDCKCLNCRIRREEKEAEEKVTGLMFRFRVSYAQGEAFVTARNESELKLKMLALFGVDDYIILDKQ
jgi:hypothetical protein